MTMSSAAQASWSKLLMRVRRAVRAFESERTDTKSTWTFRIRLERDDLDGGWTAECIDLPGCVSDGATQEDAIRNISDAIGEVIAVRMSNHALQSPIDDDPGSMDRELALTVG